VTTTWWAPLAGALQAITVLAVGLLTVFIAWTLLADMWKLRRRGLAGARTLDERIGAGRLAAPLAPDAPSGQVDQLRTPELLEAAQRKSG
jgi:hypothetical protein